jgi:hypothetical protein
MKGVISAGRSSFTDAIRTEAPIRFWISVVFHAVALVGLAPIALHTTGEAIAQISHQ